MVWMMIFFKTKVMVEAIVASKPKKSMCVGFEPKRSMCVGFEHGVDVAKLLKQM